MLHENETPNTVDIDFSALLEGEDTALPADGKKLSVHDALMVTESRRLAPDLDEIAALSGVSKEEAAAILLRDGALYRHPLAYNGDDTENLVDATYIGGMLGEKLELALEANKKYPGKFDTLIEALRARMPRSMTGTEGVYISPSNKLAFPYLNDFIVHMMGVPRLADFRKHPERYACAVNANGRVVIPQKKRYGLFHVPSVHTYGTSDMCFLEILEHMINETKLEVNTTDYTGKSRPDPRKTQMVRTKATLIYAEWQEWLWSNKKRARELLEAFSAKYDSFAPPVYNITPTFTGMNPDIRLRKSQVEDAVQCILADNTLLARDTGAGKTYIIAAAVQKMRELGISMRNLIVVDNNNLGQWKQMYLRLFPDADLLVLDRKAFSPANYQATLRHIRDEDHDAVIMRHASLNKIGFSAKYYYAQTTAEINRLKALRIVAASKDRAALTREIKKLSKKAVELNSEMKTQQGMLFFEDLGFTRMIVDEAHFYKNISVNTRGSHYLGVSARGASMCNTMLERVDFIHRQNGGKGVIFSTATPFPNSIADVYTMQRYLQPEVLRALECEDFSEWIAVFCEVSPDYELDVTSQYKFAYRLSKFQNFSQLVSHLSGIMCRHEDAEDERVIPLFTGYKDIVVPMTEGYKEFQKTGVKRAEAIHKRRVEPKEDNYLKLTVEYRMAAVDARLLSDKARSEMGKIYYCAQQVARIYKDTAAQKLTQAVFLDIGTPKNAFNAYDELRMWLEYFGVAREDIAYVHDATTEKRRMQLFEQFNNGDVRILIGSTPKLGTGANIQARLRAIHHLDVPWRPCDMIQRDGRAFREGNLNDEVDAYRYVMEKSADAYSWQLLEIKSRIINSILSGDAEINSGENIDEATLSYAEIKALAVGSPLIKERIICQNQLARAVMLQRKQQEECDILRTRLLEVDDRREQLGKLILDTKPDVALAQRYPRVDDKEMRAQIRARLARAIERGASRVAETNILYYRGFRIFLPVWRDEEKPAPLCVQAHGSYLIDVPKVQAALVRIDNCIDSLAQRVEQYIQSADALDEDRQALKRQLEENSTDDYEQEIARLKARIRYCDEKLNLAS